MKFQFISKRLWDKELGTASAYQFLVRPCKAGGKCRSANKLTEKYFFLYQLPEKLSEVDCVNTFSIRTTCCHKDLAKLDCESGWKLYHKSNTRITVKDFTDMQTDKKSWKDIMSKVPELSSLPRLNR
tara:strand:- start:110 stop:490 length:381 start_codon:yes stop_codon:yes gene_type:complete